MNVPKKSHETTFYVQVQRKRNPTFRNGKYNTVSAAKLTTERPAQPMKDSVTVKLTIRIPDEAFDPISPSAVIDIPASLVQQPMEIIVEDNS